MSVQSTVFANYDNAYRDARANSDGGGGGWWPEPGQHNCIVTSISVIPSTFKMNAGETTTELPSNLITFRYQLMEDPGSPGDPREFEGAAFNFPQNQDRVTAPGQQTRIRIELERIKGHFNTVLGSSGVTNNPQIDLDNAQKAVADGTVAVVVNCVHQPKGDRVYKKDYLVRRL